MANQTLTAPYTAYIDISFSLSAGQATNRYSSGIWSLPHNHTSAIPFTVPPNMKIDVIDIKQLNLLKNDLIFDCIINGFPQNIKFDVNRAHVKNPAKAILPTISANPLDMIEFIAYPVSSPNTAVTEVVNAVFCVTPI